ncbi:hypothetical protein T4C_9927 [Trichinella pseudospiralis]|uniref:Uncharacterized protein n=1 Tax=Trichinella pseudospiralis TaxID=6337 RepID=A0A0V1GL66_TRIPS|nr:hypothetical protein T4C_9927 [Trichinella pseudospiralis]
MLSSSGEIMLMWTGWGREKAETGIYNGILNKRVRSHRTFQISKDDGTLEMIF